MIKTQIFIFWFLCSSASIAQVSLENLSYRYSSVNISLLDIDYYLVEQGFFDGPKRKYAYKEMGNSKVVIEYLLDEDSTNRSLRIPIIVDFFITPKYCFLLIDYTKVSSKHHLDLGQSRARAELNNFFLIRVGYKNINIKKKERSINLLARGNDAQLAFSKKSRSKSSQTILSMDSCRQKLSEIRADSILMYDISIPSKRLKNSQNGGIAYSSGDHLFFELAFDDELNSFYTNRFLFIFNHETSVVELIE